MDNKNITIEQAEEIIAKDILHDCKNLPFADAYVDDEDLYSRFYDNIENPTGEKLLKVFDLFYNNEDVLFEIETAMLDAAEQVINKKIREICKED